MKNKPLVVLFDANPIINGNRSGVGYYSYRLLDALAKEYPDELRIKAHYFNFLGRKQGLDLPKHPNITYVQSKIIPGKILNILRKIGLQLPLELFFKSRGDAAIFTNFVSLPSIFRVPTFVAVHDLCYEDVPEYVSGGNRLFLQRFVPGSVARARKVITISESSKQAIIKHYGVPAKDIVITPIPPADDSVVKATKPAGIGDRKFLLFIGTIEPRKNLARLVEAYVGLPSDLKDSYSLVLAGGIGWDIEETVAEIKRQQAAGENIILTGYVTDGEKKWLYQNASVLVLPSHYEGFGMPIVEAMARDLPTIVSDIPVFHEVGNTASIYFDKDDTDSIKRAVVKVLNDKTIRDHMIKKGREQASEYNWEDIANRLYQTLRQS